MEYTVIVPSEMKNVLLISRFEFRANCQEKSGRKKTMKTLELKNVIF